MENPPDFYTSDFLEVSSQLFHKKIAKVQLDQDKRKKDFMKQLTAWASDQCLHGAHQKTVQYACQQYIDRAQAQLRQELDQTIAAEDLEKMKRDYAIQEFGVGVEVR